jgi:hypothetical protein
MFSEAVSESSAGLTDIDDVTSGANNNVNKARCCAGEVLSEVKMSRGTLDATVGVFGDISTRVAAASVARKSSCIVDIQRLGNGVRSPHQMVGQVPVPFECCDWWILEDVGCGGV